jgi:dienelactone hydrolase
MYVWLITVAILAAAPEDLAVLPKEMEAGPTNRAYGRQLQSEAYAAFARRTKAYEALKTPEQIAAYQTKLREFFVTQIGGYPERTPLNAQVVGRRKCDGYRLEKILFESQPRHYVSALLYLPNGPPPYPGVIVPCGHTADGKIGYFRISAFLARSGFAALCYDPIGQGERYQVLDADGKPLMKSTSEHTAVGIGSILVGRNTASYRIWDGMRAIDYLTSRDDVDATKIGCTGISGGGTLTEYLMALDDRIGCAAPGCAINTFERRVAKSAPGDAEQNIFGQIGFGLDHADYIHLRAPKPTLLLCATRDFVDIEGSWTIFREAKRLYARLGYSERIDLLEADEQHGFPKPLREQSVRWMRRWLVGRDDAVQEPQIEPLPAGEMLVTPRGQVQLLADARSVMDLNADVAAKAESTRRTLWQPANRAATLEAVRGRVGASRPAELPLASVETVGRVEREGYAIEKLVLSYEETSAHPSVPLPALLFRPAKTTRRVLYLHGSGKHVDALPGGPIEKLVQEGALVLAVDVRGSGETGRGGTGSAEFSDIFFTYLLGKSLVGRRADDIAVAARYLASLEPRMAGKPEVVAVGPLAIPALHAVALDSTSYERLTLRGAMKSWLDVVRDPALSGQLANIVHGALLEYDLPDLVESLPSSFVVVESALK